MIELQLNKQQWDCIKAALTACDAMILVGAKFPGYPELFVMDEDLGVEVRTSLVEMMEMAEEEGLEGSIHAFDL